MTLEQLEKAKGLAVTREALLREVTKIERADCPSMLFGYALDEAMEGVLRTAFAGELRRRAGEFEAELRELGILFPGPEPTLRSPVSWDEASGEFTFVVASTEVELSGRGLGYTGYIPVDQVILPRGHREARRPVEIVACGRTRETPIGEVVRVWEEDGRILGRGRLRPEASAARAAVASGAVTHVGILIDTHEERATPRDGLRPLVTVEAWSVGGVTLISDDLGLNKLDPRDECPGKAEAA